MWSIHWLTELHNKLINCSLLIHDMKMFSQYNIHIYLIRFVLKVYFFVTFWNRHCHIFLLYSPVSKNVRCKFWTFLIQKCQFPISSTEAGFWVYHFWYKVFVIKRLKRNDLTGEAQHADHQKFLVVFLLKRVKRFLSELSSNNTTNNAVKCEIVTCIESSFHSDKLSPTLPSIRKFDRRCSTAMQHH